MAAPLDLGSAFVLKALDATLLAQPYISGFQASMDDVIVFEGIPRSELREGIRHAVAPSAELPSLRRWHAHITALLLKSFPAGGGHPYIPHPALAHTQRVPLSSSPPSLSTATAALLVFCGGIFISSPVLLAANLPSFSRGESPCLSGVAALATVPTDEAAMDAHFAKSSYVTMSQPSFDDFAAYVGMKAAGLALFTLFCSQNTTEDSHMVQAACYQAVTILRFMLHSS
jgi:hypothetical protein